MTQPQLIVDPVVGVFDQKFSPVYVAVVEHGGYVVVGVPDSHCYVIVGGSSGHSLHLYNSSGSVLSPPICTFRGLPYSFALIIEYGGA